MVLFEICALLIQCIVLIQYTITYLWPLRTLRARTPPYTEYRGVHPARTRALFARQSSGRPAAAATVCS